MPRPTQVVLLLKSSDRISHDLAAIRAMPAALRPRPQLALRKWYDLRPEREFRCFVRGRQLVAISQRDPTQYFPQLQGGVCAGMAASIAAFVRQHVLPAFPLEHYTCDIYVAASGRVKLVDFNPVGGTTSALLFRWEELYAAAAAAAAPAREQAAEQALEGAAGRRSAELRIVEDASTLQAGQRAAVAMPYDMLGLGDTMGNIMQRVRAQQAAGA
jgi:hypothetical protein